jgi:putative mRNA 3-end processing factor
MHVRVSAKGAVQLGEVVVCDGFITGCKVRVQTHIHMDHMDQFTTSKGYQDVLMTQATRDLLIAEYNGDLAYRENVKAVNVGEAFQENGCEIVLLNNGHMLGSAQVVVTLPDGIRCGYSGDFSWPLDEVIQVDELVVDTTYGSPDSVRRFQEEEADQQLAELVVAKLHSGPIFLSAHRGTLQRSLSTLDDAIKCPVIVPPKTFKEIEVYRKWGYSLTQVISSDTAEAKQLRKGNRYIFVDGIKRGPPHLPKGATSIILSAFRGSKKHPVIEYSEKAYNVSLSGHADYKGTIDYIRATGAKTVLTDNTRGGHAVELALAIQQELGIEAKASEVQYHQEWGS